MALTEWVGSVATTLNRLRSEPGVGELVEFSNGVVVQYQVHPEQLGDDGLYLMVIEIVSPHRLGRQSKARMRESGWTPPQKKVMPGWWHLVASAREAKIVAGRLLIVIPEIYQVPTAEVFAWPAPPERPEPLASRGSSSGDRSSGTGPPRDTSALAAMAARWNKLAADRGLPQCDPRIDEDSDLLRCLFPDVIVPGTNSGVDLEEVGDRFQLRFTVNNEGSPPAEAMRQALAPLVPEPLHLQILPTSFGGHLEIRVDVFAGDSDEDLVEKWSLGARVTTVCRAATYPWDDFDVPDAAALGFCEGDFSLEGCEDPLGRVISCAAVYMSHFAEQVDPHGGYVSREFADGEEATHLDLIRAYATGYGTPELLDVYGRWIGGEVSSWRRMCCVDQPFVVAEGLGWDHFSDRPGWHVLPWDLSPGQERRLRLLGWQQSDDDPYVIPSSRGSVDEGRIVARTAVEVLGEDLRESIRLKLNLSDWRDAGEELESYIESGWVDDGDTH